MYEKCPSGLNIFTGSAPKQQVQLQLHNASSHNTTLNYSKYLRVRPRITSLLGT